MLLPTCRQLSTEPARDEVQVAQGVYRRTLPNGDREESFDLGKASGATIRGGYAGRSGPDGRPVLLACRFSDNRADNSGGGLYHSNSHAELIGCAFYDNQAADGGGMYNDLSDPNLTNCLFSGNRAERGGGVYNDLSRPNLVNCTFSRNAADDFGGGLYNFDASPMLTNCILWANSDTGGTDEQALIHMPSEAVVRHCCIQGWTDRWGRPGNIDRDPRFADDDGPDDRLGTEDDDLSLRQRSPCIDTGDSNALPFVTCGFDGSPQPAQRTSFDFAGNPRIANDRVDLGAFEFCADLEPGDLIYVDANAPGPAPGDGFRLAAESAAGRPGLQRAAAPDLGRRRDVHPFGRRHTGERDLLSR
jgi:hypothetical protein